MQAEKNRRPDSTMRIMSVVSRRAYRETSFLVDWIALPITLYSSFVSVMVCDDWAAFYNRKIGNKLLATEVAALGGMLNSPRTSKVVLLCSTVLAKS